MAPRGAITSEQPPAALPAPALLQVVGTKRLFYGLSPPRPSRPRPVFRVGPTQTPGALTRPFLLAQIGERGTPCADRKTDSAPVWLGGLDGSNPEHRGTGGCQFVSPLLRMPERRWASEKPKRWRVGQVSAGVFVGRTSRKKYKG